MTPSPQPLRLGTRGSPLALVQAEMVRRAYLDRFPDRAMEVVVVTTRGDREASRPLPLFGGQGVFVKEIEERLLAGDIDAAVHSAKDLAVEDTDGVELVAFLERGPAHDVLVRATAGLGLATPGEGFRIATDSTRRRTQLAEAWPGVEFVDIRGNIETRLGKLAAGAAEGLVLAAAGLRRLQLEPEGAETIGLTVCVPAPGQGALAVQCREDDPSAADLRLLNHLQTALAVQTERDVASALSAGCEVPVGAYVEFRGGETRLLVALHDGQALYRVSARSAARSPHEAVEEAMADLRDRGARWGARR
jgi:hydroxymethylbilane synthase